jgi:L-serine deaminase
VTCLPVADAMAFPRINLNNTVSIATTNGSELQMGTLIRESGTKQTLINNDTGTVFDIIIDNISAFAVNYTISRAPTGIRTGTISVVTNPLFYSDDYIDNSDTGITLFWTQVGTTLTLNYTATDAGENATISYSTTYFS